MQSRWPMGLVRAHRMLFGLPFSKIVSNKTVSFLYTYPASLFCGSYHLLPHHQQKRRRRRRKEGKKEREKKKDPNQYRLPLIQTHGLRTWRKNSSDPPLYCFTIFSGVLHRKQFRYVLRLKSKGKHGNVFKQASSVHGWS